MAAGLGFKTFNTGDVLSAADTNGYLMQGIWVFANATARDAAVTSPQEGNSCYLKDTDVIQVYSGSAWVTKSGGSPLTTKGDLYTYSTTDARLGVGTNGQVLTADSAEATGLKWASQSAGGYTELATGTLSGATTTISGISGSYKDLILYVYDYVISGAGGGAMFLRINGSSSSEYFSTGVIMEGSAGTAVYTNNSGTEEYFTGYGGNTADNNLHSTFIFRDYSQTVAEKNYQYIGTSLNNSSGRFTVKNAMGNFRTTSAITSLVIHSGSNSFTGGTYYLYGVK
jgi:hypothetical protein